MRDSALLTRWHETRDPEAFRALTVRYGRVVYAATIRVLGNESDAEDVTQECFEKLAATRKAPDTYLGPWLHRMAVHKAIDRLRSEKRKHAREARYVAETELPIEPTWNDIYPIVDEAIDALPDKWRRAVVAHYLEGRTQEDIANTEHVSRSAVNYRIQHGIERIRRTLNKKDVVAPAAGLASFLAANAAEAAPLSQALTQRLGRLALSGTHVHTGSNLVAFLTWQKFALTGLALIGAIAAGVAVQQFNEGSRSDATANPATSLSSPAGTILARDDVADLSTTSDVPVTRSTDNASYVEGRVFDRETSDGIAGARVFIAARSSRWSTSIFTDNNGAFRTGTLEPGRYEMACVEANGYLIPFMSGDDLDPDSFVHADLSDGKPRTEIEIALGRGQTFRGRITDMAGSPVAGARVTARMEKENTPRVNTTFSATDGSFEVSGFPETVGLYAWAEADRLVSKTYGPHGLPQHAKSTTIVVNPESIIRGAVVDDSGRPLEGLRVVPQFVQSEAEREVEATTDAQGRYELTSMFPGGSFLRVCRDVEIVNQPVPSITLTAGEVVENLTLICRTANHTIEGIVVSESGAPLANANVWCSGVRERTDVRGRFVIKGLMSGAFRLSVSRAGHMHADIPNVATGRRNVRIVLPREILVEGRIIHAETGDPISDFEIKYCYPHFMMLRDRGYEKMVSFNGSYALNVKQEGHIRIAARAHGFLIGYTDVQIKATEGDSDNVVIMMRPSNAIRGVVHDQRGTPLEGVAIRSDIGKMHNPNITPAGRSAADGSFTIDPVRVGDLALMFTHPDLPKTITKLNPEHLEGVPLEVVLYEGTELNATALFDGTPFPNATLHFPGIDETIHAGADGRAIAKSIPPGTHRIDVIFNSADGRGNHFWMTYEDEIEIAPGSRTAAIIDAAAGTGSVSGKIEGFVRQTSLRLSLDTADGRRHYNRLFDSEVPPTYAFEQVPAGSGRLHFRYTMPDQQVGTANFDVTIAEGEHLAIHLTLDALTDRSG